MQKHEADMILFCQERINCDVDCKEGFEHLQNSYVKMLSQDGDIHGITVTPPL